MLVDLRDASFAIDILYINLYITLYIYICEGIFFHGHVEIKVFEDIGSGFLVKSWSWEGSVEFTEGD